MDNQGFKFCTIGNSSVVFYNKITKNKGTNGNSSKSRENLSKSYGSLHLTTKSKKQINKIVYHWSNAVELNQDTKKKFKQVKRRSLSMVTLTLPANQVLCDKDVNKLYLSPFMNRLKKLKPTIHYLWVAEKQKNGSLHYHIIIDLFVSKLWIREVWNRILLDGPEMNLFKAKFNRVNPPSTEVDSLKKIKNGCAYLTKYITKLDTVNEIECKKWDCDSELLQLSSIILSSKGWYIEEFAHYLKYFDIKKYQDDFFAVFTFNSHFHSSFKFLNVYHDLLPQLLYYYVGLYSEIKLLNLDYNYTIKDVRPPQPIQGNLNF